MNRTSGLRYLLFLALALAGLARGAEPAGGILKAEALAKVEDCVNAGATGACVPTTRAELLEKCAADFCTAASAPASLSADRILELLRNIATALQNVGAQAALLKPAAAELQARAERAVHDIANGKRVDANPWAVTDAANPAGSDGRAALEKCKTPVRNTCSAEAANLLALRASSEAFRALVQQINRPDLEKSVACTKLLRKRYDSYFDASRFQWPWELWFNGRPSARGDLPMACEGFRDVPAHQWIVLHPSLALRYSENASQKTDAVFLIEVFGMRRWQWKEAEAVNVRGGSIILGFSNQSDAKTMGWGAMVHLKDDVSVGMLRHKSDVDNKVSIVLGYDFGTLVRQDKDAACQKLFDKELCKRIAK